MKPAILLTLCALILTSAAGFATAPSAAPLTTEALAAILGPSSSCPAPESEALFTAAKPQEPGIGPLKLTDWCDECAQTGDCYACCRCDGHPSLICERAC